MYDLSRLTAAILAGGLGTRLRAVVGDRQKVVAEVKDRPFVAFLLDQLAAEGIRSVVLCTGFCGDQVEASLGRSYKSLHLDYSREQEPLGTAGALRLARPFLKTDPVLIMNGDSFCQVDLKEFLAWHCTKKAQATLVLTRVPDTARYGRVETDAQGRVLSFNEKDGHVGAPGWINAGIYLINQWLLDTIPADGPVSLEHDMFPCWRHLGLYGYRSEGSFLDIGTPETYASAQSFFSHSNLACPDWAQL